MHALLFGPVPVKKGMTVLTQGTRGVSCFAIQVSLSELLPIRLYSSCKQIASGAGATVIATSSSDAKLEIARKLGATHTINYITYTDWENEVLRLTNDEGVDHVLEVGGGKTIEQSVACTKHGGLISLVGFLGGKKEVDIVGPLVFGAKTGESGASSLFLSPSPYWHPILTRMAAHSTRCVSYQKEAYCRAGEAL
jgi:NADPH:quinone reductase-like Zn-dependent oxidoreductase